MSKIVPLEGFGGGGSSPLNFKIVAYATEEELAAAQPKENTIGVVTTDTITSWIFDATEPTEPMEGMVWISTSTSSTVAFNAMKKNGIQVYPFSTKQYISGAWVDKTAKSYQDSKWVDWITYLFKSGVGESILFASRGASNWSINKTNERIRIVTSNIASGEGYYQTEEKVDLSGKTTLTFRAKCTSFVGATASKDPYYVPRFYVSNNSMQSVGLNPMSMDWAADVYLTADSVTKEYMINVSSLNGSYYVGYWGVGVAEIYDIYIR